MACIDTFIITVTGRTRECTITVDSADKNNEWSVDDLIVGAGEIVAIVTAVAISYTVGNPAKTVFASSYEKTRTGGTGDPPDLGSITFNSEIDLGGGALAMKNNTVTIGLPTYSQSAADVLGATGVDKWDVSLYIRGDSESIAGSPSNLTPENPT